jgi:PhnB protein
LVPRHIIIEDDQYFNNQLNKAMSNTHTLHTYIHFDGRCEEAIAFYQQAVGAVQLMLSRYKEAPQDSPGQPCPPGSENKIMHARLNIGGTTVMMSDGPCSGRYEGFSLTLVASTPAEAERLFAALSPGGKVDMPLAKTFFSPAFGMLTDRFGVKWMVLVHDAI